MNGDAPANESVGLWMIREQVVLKPVEVAQLSNPNARFFARFRFVEAHLVQSFSSYS
jgi:hypothetical protein